LVWEGFLGKKVKKKTIVVGNTPCNSLEHLDRENQLIQGLFHTSLVHKCLFHQYSMCWTMETFAILSMFLTSLT